MRKTTDPDGNPNLAFRVAIEKALEMSDVLCRDVRTRESSQRFGRDISWKSPGDSSVYRPICLLDMTGKKLEKIILNSLLKYFEGVDGFQNYQFGLRKKLTVDANLSVTKTVVIALRKT